MEDFLKENRPSSISYGMRFLMWSAHYKDWRVMEIVSGCFADSHNLLHASPDFTEALEVLKTGIPKE